MDDLLAILLTLAAIVVPLLLAWFLCARGLQSGRGERDKRAP